MAWVLEAEYGSAWWEKGILAPLRREDSPYLRNLPTQGNRDDLDLYLCLKLTQANQPLFEKHLQWDAAVWKSVAAVFRARNEYEGHVTKNREDGLTTEHARDILQNISLLLLRLHENHESDSIMLMKPLAKELEKADFSPEQKEAPKFRPPEKRRKALTGQQEWRTVTPASPKAPRQPVVNPNLPPDLRDVKISPQLHPEEQGEIRQPAKPKSPLDMPEIPDYLKGGPVHPLPRQPHTRQIPEVEEPSIPVQETPAPRRPRTRQVPEAEEPSIPTQEAPAPSSLSPAPRKQPARTEPAPVRKPTPKRTSPSLPEDPYAVVPSALPGEMDTLRQIQQSARMQAPPPPVPRTVPPRPVKAKSRSTRVKAAPPGYKGWQGILRWFFLLAGAGGLLYLFIWLDQLLKKP